MIRTKSQWLILLTGRVHSQAMAELILSELAGYKATKPARTEKDTATLRNAIDALLEMQVAVGPDNTVDHAPVDPDAYAELVEEQAFEHRLGIKAAQRLKGKGVSGSETITKAPDQLLKRIGKAG